jgi:D-serine deaminase-like pyridoxal phosphate-dependent protein
MATTTARAGKDYIAVTEMRAGNFVSFDLVMEGIRASDLSDQALSVVASVIGHWEDKDCIMTRCWMVWLGRGGAQTDCCRT